MQPSPALASTNLDEILNECQLNLAICLLSNNKHSQAVVHLSALIQNKGKKQAKLHYLRAKALSKVTSPGDMIPYALGDLQLAKSFTKDASE